MRLLPCGCCHAAVDVRIAIWRGEEPVPLDESLLLVHIHKYDFHSYLARHEARARYAHATPAVPRNRGAAACARARWPVRRLRRAGERAQLDTAARTPGSAKWYERESHTQYFTSRECHGATI